MKPECFVCFESYDAEDSLAAVDCGHVVHLACLDKWLEQADTCPVCRCEATISVDGTVYVRPVYIRFDDIPESEPGPSNPAQSSEALRTNALNSLRTQARVIQEQIDALGDEATPGNRVTRDLLTSFRSAQAILEGMGQEQALVETARTIAQQAKDMGAQIRRFGQKATQDLERERRRVIDLQNRLDQETASLRTATQQTAEEARKRARLETQLEKATQDAAREHTEMEARHSRHVEEVQNGLQNEVARLTSENEAQVKKLQALVASEEMLKSSVRRYKQQLDKRKETQEQVAMLEEKVLSQENKIAALSKENKKLKEDVAMGNATEEEFATKTSAISHPLTTRNLKAHTVLEKTRRDPFIIPPDSAFESSDPMVDVPLLDKSMYGAAFARQPLVPLPSSSRPSKPSAGAKRKEQPDGILAYLGKPSSLTTGPKRSRRIP